MTRRGGHWACYRVSVGIEIAGFRPVEKSFRRDERKTCRPRAISVTRCGSSSSSFWASRAVSVPMVCQQVRWCFTKKMDQFSRRGKRYRSGSTASRPDRGDDFPMSPGTLLGYGSIFPTAAITVSTTTRCRRVNCQPRI